MKAASLMQAGQGQKQTLSVHGSLTMNMTPCRALLKIHTQKIALMTTLNSTGKQLPWYNKSISHFPRSNPNPDIALEKNRPLVSSVPNMEHRLLILRENELNWFELVAELGILLQNYSEDTLAYELT